MTASDMRWACMSRAGRGRVLRSARVDTMIHVGLFRFAWLWLGENPLPIVLHIHDAPVAWRSDHRFPPAVIPQAPQRHWTLLGSGTSSTCEARVGSGRQLDFHESLLPLGCPALILSARVSATSRRSAAMRAGPGLRRPFAHILTSAWVMPRRWATSRCVSPHEVSRRKSRISSTSCGIGKT